MTLRVNRPKTEGQSGRGVGGIPNQFDARPKHMTCFFTRGNWWLQETIESVCSGLTKDVKVSAKIVDFIVYRMEFDKTQWSCPWNSDQNCTQNSARG